MSDVTVGERLQIEEALGMGTGYVAGFTNRGLERFVHDVLGIGIYGTEYGREGPSKASRLRVLLREASNDEVAQLLEALHRQWELIKAPSASWEAPPVLLSVAERLRAETDGDTSSQAAAVEKALASAVTGDEFTVLISAVRDAVEDGQPAAGLDRLHTYLTKLFRALCDKHSIGYDRTTPLNGLAGLYIRHLRETHQIEAEMTVRILKGTVRVLEEFNDVRNNRTLAHANELLGHDESMLIMGDIANLVRFISSKEETLPTLGDGHDASAR